MSAERAALTAVSYVVFRTEKRVLLQQRKNTGYLDGHWATAAAGHVEHGETAVEAAVRECREELGLAIAAEQLVPLTVLHRLQPDGQEDNDRVDFFFECLNWSGEPRLMEPEKAAALQWFALDNLPEPFVPHELYVMKKLAEGQPLPAIVYQESALPS